MSNTIETRFNDIIELLKNKDLTNDEKEKIIKELLELKEEFVKENIYCYDAGYERGKLEGYNEGYNDALRGYEYD